MVTYGNRKCHDKDPGDPTGRADKLPNYSYWTQVTITNLGRAFIVPLVWNLRFWCCFVIILCSHRGHCLDCPPHWLRDGGVQFIRILLHKVAKTGQNFCWLVGKQLLQTFIFSNQTRIRHIFDATCQIWACPCPQRGGGDWALCSCCALCGRSPEGLFWS